jgi:integrase
MTAQPDPYRPEHFVVFPVGNAKSTKRGGKTVKCWDVRGRADGDAFFRRFTAPEGTAEMAKAYARGLLRDFEDGTLLWDHAAKKFVEPVTVEVKQTTVADWCLRYWVLQVGEWEPATRAWAARSLGRAIRGLLREHAPAIPSTVDTLLEAALAPQPVTAGHEAALAWLDKWSMPITDVGHEHLEALLEAHSRRLSDGAPVAPATAKRFVADLRQCWQTAHARGLIVRDPWPAVRITRKAKRKGRVEKATRGVQAVNPDTVLSPAQVWELADAVAAQTASAGRYKAFVAVMGLCGLRPSEACGVAIGDIELPEISASASTVDIAEVGWLTVRRSARIVSSRWIADDEDPDFGPLKGRASDEDRRTLIPSSLVPVLRDHLATYRAEAGDDDLAFITATGLPIDLSRFDRDYWSPAREHLFGTDPVLSGLHRHDLRHAACSMWLASGVPIKTATQWSGHKTVSVFLDIYQGVLPGSEDQGIAAVERYLDGTAD